MKNKNDDNLLNLKSNIFNRAKIFIENIGEFAPFGAKLLNNEIKDVVFYNDENEVFDAKKIIEILHNNFSEELKKMNIQIGAYAYDTIANFKNSDGISERKNALCLKISTNGNVWTEDYYPYKIYDNKLVWG